MRLTKTFIITVGPSTEDMPLDSAVYVPTVGARAAFIAGVRGGYAYRFDPNTGTKISSIRFRSVSFSDSCIIYHSASDSLIVSCWNDPGWEVGSGTSPYRLLYKMNPATWGTTTAVISTFDPIVTFAVTGGTLYQGPHQIRSAGANVLGVYYDSSPNPIPFYWNPTSNASVNGLHASGYSSWIDPMIDSGGLDVFVPDALRARLWDIDAVTLDINLSSGNYVQWPTPNPTVQMPIGICQNTGPTGTTGKLYIASRSNALFTCSNVISSAGQAPTANITLPGTAPQPWKVRFNSNDNLIYVPCYGENTVNIVDPATDTVVATKSGFDSPFDCIFTPTKKWAVQHGSTPLMQIAYP